MGDVAGGPTEHGEAENEKEDSLSSVTPTSLAAALVPGRRLESYLEF